MPTDEGKLQLWELSFNWEKHRVNPFCLGMDVQSKIVHFTSITWLHLECAKFYQE